mmetsp:Transcript_3948/g.9532  ORF Transcript_3948/g.9532 Transcript_3948/m.9532 type:complete len:201 (-) Transcript_3948:967-1569(-)
MVPRSLPRPHDVSEPFQGSVIDSADSRSAVNRVGSKISIRVVVVVVVVGVGPRRCDGGRNRIDLGVVEVGSRNRIHLPSLPGRAPPLSDRLTVETFLVEDFLDHYLVVPVDAAHLSIPQTIPTSAHIIQDGAPDEIEENSSLEGATERKHYGRVHQPHEWPAIGCNGFVSVHGVAPEGPFAGVFVDDPGAPVRRFRTKSG